MINDLNGMTQEELAALALAHGVKGAKLAKRWKRETLIEKILATVNEKGDEAPVVFAPETIVTMEAMEKEFAVDVPAMPAPEDIVKIEVVAKPEPVAIPVVDVNEIAAFFDAKVVAFDDKTLSLQRGPLTACVRLNQTDEQIKRAFKQMGF